MTSPIGFQGYCFVKGFWTTQIGVPYIGHMGVSKIRGPNMDPKIIVLLL